MGEIDLHIRNIHEVHRETLVQKYLRLMIKYWWRFFKPNWLNLVSKTKQNKSLLGTLYLHRVTLLLIWTHLGITHIFSQDYPLPYQKCVTIFSATALDAWSLTYPAVQWLITSSALLGTSIAVMTNPFMMHKCHFWDCSQFVFQVTRSSTKFDYFSYHEIRLR